MTRLLFLLVGLMIGAATGAAGKGYPPAGLAALLVGCVLLVAGSWYAGQRDRASAVAVAVAKARSEATASASSAVNVAIVQQQAAVGDEAYARERVAFARAASPAALEGGDERFIESAGVPWLGRGLHSPGGVPIASSNPARGGAVNPPEYVRFAHEARSASQDQMVSRGVDGDGDADTLPAREGTGRPQFGRWSFPQDHPREGAPVVR